MIAVCLAFQERYFPALPLLLTQHTETNRYSPLLHSSACCTVCVYTWLCVSWLVLRKKRVAGMKSIHCSTVCQARCIYRCRDVQIRASGPQVADVCLRHCGSRSRVKKQVSLLACMQYIILRGEAGIRCLDTLALLCCAMLCLTHACTHLSLAHVLCIAFQCCFAP